MSIGGTFFLLGKEMKKQIVGALLLLMLAAPGIGQEEAQPYFSLSSNQTFAPGSKVAVNLSGFNVNSLEFRVYRVNDAVKFFEQLESPNSFGTFTARRRTEERTVIEKVRGWKRRLRANIRRGLRAQFTESPRSHLQNASPQPSQPAAPQTRYVEAPVLNSQQLVLTFQQGLTTKDRWANQSVPLGLTEKGVYLVEASRGNLQAYTMVMISDLVMTSKTARGKIVNYIASRATGEPVADVELSMVAPNQPRVSVKTSSDGIAEIPLGDRKPDDVRLVARSGADIAANALASYSFGVTRDEWTSYIYTDRPIYRPGHTVHFKGMFRVRTPEGYTLPKELQLPVQIQDSSGNTVLQQQLSLSTNGTVNGELALPAKAALGYYFIQFQVGDRYMTGTFEVEEYKKPEYEVRVTPAQPRIIQGAPISAVIDAKYYFGEPVKGASVKYSVYRDRYWFPVWYDPDDDEAEQFEDEGYGGEEIDQGEGTLDDDGELAIKIATKPSENAVDYRYRIEARVTDAARREISGSGSIVATYGSFLVNVSPEQYVYNRGARAGFTIEARNYDNQPVAAPVHLELTRFDWRDLKKKQAVIATADALTDANGSARAEIGIPNEGGEFRVRVTARTPEGRTVEDSTYIWVSGTIGTSYVEPREPVEIVPDKKTYRPGDIAHLLIATGQAGAALLVSVEGRDLRSYKLLRAGEAMAAFDLPVTERDEPGLYVTAQFMRGGTMYRSSKYIRVPADDHKLNVAVTTDKQQYRPGETATYDVRVTDNDGKPVPRAELSLGVVDEAIYAIRRDNAPDMMRQFFGRDYNRVSTEDSLSYYFSGEAGTRRMQLAQLRPPTKLAQLKPERLALPKVRKAFPDTAFWAADITTDAQGRAQARVELPDSLTTWRATARGITSDTKVGAAVAKNITRKNLILRFSTPRFFVRGDEVTISAIVHNYLESAQNTQVSLAMTGLDIVTDGAKTVSIPPRDEVRIDWRVRASALGMAKITGRALGAQESDALEVEIPVNAAGVKLSESKGGSLPAGQSNSFDLTFPANVEAGSRRIAIRVSPSIAGALFGAVEYLTTFPYGCVEQTMSSFLPNIIVQQTVKDLGLKADLDQAQLRDKIAEGLERLYAFQHQDGGWGWWQTDESHAFMTAYVVAGLLKAQANGTSVRGDVVERGAKWIETALAQAPALAPDLRAYMMYSLATRDTTLPLDRLYTDRAKLSPYGLALLGLTFEQRKDSRVASIATQLEKAVQQDAEQAWWPAERDELLDFATDATPEATAFATRFLSHVIPNSPLLPKAAVWLMNHRNEGYWWSSTKQTAMVIYGLADYLKVTKELNPSFAATVTVNGREAVNQRFDTATGLAEAEIVLDESKLQAGVNQLQVTTNGSGRLYYSARAEYFSSEQRLERKGTISLNVLRDYFRLSPTRNGEKIVYDTLLLDGPVQTGDTIAVRLTVTGSEWSYLLIEDPIPAGTEFIERDTNYELRNRPPWWRYFFTHREMHDDRMAIFERSFPAGQRDYFYLLKVVNPGAFYASPTRVQPMYQPSTLATSAGRKVEVQ